MINNDNGKFGWTRSLLSAAIVVGLFGATGCQIHRNPGPSAMDPEPEPIDPAMQSRQWEQSSAIYENVSVTSKPTLFLLDSAPDQPDYRYAFTETPIFFANLFMMPYAAFKTPPWITIEHRLESVPPTYTAMPMLPPEPQPEQSDLAQPPAPPSDAMPGEQPPIPPPAPEEPTTPGDHPMDQPVEPPATQPSLTQSSISHWSLSESSNASAPTTQPTFNK